MPVLEPLHSDPEAPPPSAREPEGETGDAEPLAVQVGLLVAAAVVMVDQATKHLAEQFLTRGRMVDVFADGWGWQLVYNPGGAFGFLAPSWFFLVVTVVVTVFAIRNLPRATSALQASAWGLLLAGAFGNALDRVFRPGGPEDPRFFHGEVVDFIAWSSFPRFNVADIAITIGFVLLVVSFWSDEQADAERE